VFAAVLRFTVALLGASVILGSAFSVFAYFLVAVTCGELGALLTGWGMGLGVGK
jgi:hypothetical protein